MLQFISLLYQHSCLKSIATEKCSCCNSVESCFVETCFGWMIYFWRDIIFKSRHVLILRAVGIRGPVGGGGTVRGPGFRDLFKSLPQDFDSHRSKTFFPSNDHILLYFGPTNFQTFRRPFNGLAWPPNGLSHALRKGERGVGVQGGYSDIQRVKRKKGWKMQRKDHKIK